MATSNFDGIVETATISIETPRELEDTNILCIDCTQEFVWTAGEQLFYRDKQLLNPPKRCKDCKKAKNQRLEAIELARTTGKRQRIEVRAECANCAVVTTVPFYPCQGRPVYCRDCFAEMGRDIANTAGAHI
ncbi:MAG: zinc-ribbon domain containing protein [Pyrinomonadaceae bacterium]